MGTTNLGARAWGGMRPRSATEMEVPASRPTLLTLVLRNLWRLCVLICALALRHPIATLVAAVIVLAVRTIGPFGLLAALVGAALGLLGWRRLHRRSYTRVVSSRWRSLVLYHRWWQPAMVTTGLAVQMAGEEYLPRMKKVVSTEYVDCVLVDLLAGQSPEAYEAQAERLAHTFGVPECRVRQDRPGRVWLDFRRGDPLVRPIAALEPDKTPDLERLRVGLTEDGQDWCLRLVGMHLLIAGATGAGKGSVLWSLVRAVGPALRDGSVQIWAVDPKGGMELTPGADLFTRFACETPEAMVQLLEDAVAFMRARAQRLRLSGERVHVPRTTEPLVVVLVDELAALTAYVCDRELRRRAEAALQLLLSQGRAPGVVVVAAVQDPGKDVVAFRDLFSNRVAMRLLEDVQVDMVLGRSARLHGARCELIPASLPGVGYVVVEGVREPVRVRAAYVDDSDLAEMVSRYAPLGANQERHLELIERQG